MTLSRATWSQTWNTPFGFLAKTFGLVFFTILTFFNSYQALAFNDDVGEFIYQEDKRVYDRQTAASEWLSNQEGVLDGVFDLSEKLDEHLAELRKKYPSEKDFFTAINEKSQKFEINVKGLGKAEPTMITVEEGIEFVPDPSGSGLIETKFIRQEIIYKIVHENTGLAFLLVDPDKVPNSNKHLQKYIARINRWADEKGRDVMVVSTGADDVQLHEKARTFKTWWKQFKTAVYSKPTLGDHIIAFGSAGTQVTLALLMSGLADVWANNGSLNTHPAIISLIMGYTIGTYSSVYRNLTNNGNKIERTAKQSITSLIFRYTLSVWDHAWSGKHLNIIMMGGLFGFLSTHGIMSNVAILTNIALTTAAKDEWYKVPRMREEMRKNTKPFLINIPWFGRKVQTQLKRQSVENQAVYLIPWSISLADITHVSMHVPGLSSVWGGPIPLGKMALFASVPLAKYFAVWYAEHIGYKYAPEMRKSWQNLVRFAWVKKMMLGKSRVAAMAEESLPLPTWTESLQEAAVRARMACQDLLTKFGDKIK